VENSGGLPDANWNGVPDSGTRILGMGAPELGVSRGRAVRRPRNPGCPKRRRRHDSYRVSEFQSYLVRAESCDRTRIVLPAKRRTFAIERAMKGFRELPGLWRIWESWTGDPDCGMGAIQAGEARRKTGPGPALAGLRAIEYAYETIDDRLTQRVAFAPDFGCTAVALSSSGRNDAG
jgi:hypothetical protein